MAAGLEEYLSPTGVTVIEWAERWDDLRERGEDREGYEGGEGGEGEVRTRVRRVRIEVIDENERRITYL